MKQRVNLHTDKHYFFSLHHDTILADDGQWYRATITKVLYSQHVQVTYIDFGNSEMVPVSSLKMIKGTLQEWLQLPAQAIKCSLASISPVNDAEWPDVTVERFKELIMQKQLVGKVIKKGMIIRRILEKKFLSTVDARIYF